MVLLKNNCNVSYRQHVHGHKHRKFLKKIYLPEIKLLAACDQHKHWYYSLSGNGSNCEVFQPTGAPCCTNMGEIWHGGSTLHAKFHSYRQIHFHQCSGKVWDPKNCNFLPNFKIQMPHKGISTAQFLQNCGELHGWSTIKIWRAHKVLW